MFRVSIVASMYNKRPKTLEIISKLFLPSLLNNASKEMEFILVDDCSPLSKETDKVVKSFSLELNKKLGKFTYIKNKKNLGFSGSYNEGMKKAKAELVLVTNDDVYFPKGSIERLCKTAEEHPDAGGVGPVTNYAGSFQNTLLFRRLGSYSKGEKDRIEEFSKWLYGVMGKRTYEIRRLIGFCIVYRKSILRKTGLFDTRYAFGNFEDEDLNKRIQNEGYKMIMDSGIFVEHGGVSGGSNSIFQHRFRTMKHYVINGLKFSFIHKMFLWPWILTLVGLIQVRDYGFTITKDILAEARKKKMAIPQI